MGKKKRYRSTIIRIKEILEIVERNYEIGNQKRCYKAIWRDFIYPKYGICYDTFLSYIVVKPSELKDDDDEEIQDPNQLSLF